MITRGAIAIILFSECTLNELESQVEGEIMISRRDLFGVTAVLTSVQWLHGQNALFHKLSHAELTTNISTLPILRPQRLDEKLIWMAALNSFAT